MKNKNLINIKKDLFNICKRIKKIDKNYFIVFNKVSKQFEVHCKKQKDTTFCFCAGKVLNFGVILKTIKTSVKFSLKTLTEINLHNQKLKQKAEQEIKDKNMYKFKTLINYAQNNKDINFENCFTTKWL